MFSLNLTYRYLSWRRPTAPPPALPDGVERIFVPTPGGPIELLYAAPRGKIERGPSPSPLFFVHGGEGGAWVWLEYMAYLSSRGVPCYAVSLRGHGASWCPSFLRMVFATSRRMLADDLVAGLRCAREREGGSDVVLVGHSSGGGLSQYVLSEGDVDVRGLALLGAVPGFGSIGVYYNWFKLDPLFNIRMIFHLGHPNSPLSHPALTKRVFFSDKVSDATVERFQKHISVFEAFQWPISMMRPFVQPLSVLSRISGWDSARERVLVLHGELDKLMTISVMRRLASYYRDAYTSLVAGKKLDGKTDMVSVLPGLGGLDDKGNGVRFCVVPGVAHHMQNDVGWEVGAAKLLDFYEQL